MKIDFSKRLKTWYEDQYGNLVINDIRDESERKAYEGRTVRKIEDIPIDEPVYYHSNFGVKVQHEISAYSYKPQKKLEKFLCKHFPRYQKWAARDHGHRTYSHLLTTTTSIGGGSQSIIVAMANSGDFTLEEAIWAYGTACERCMNVLTNKYGNDEDKKDGYEEYSDDWYRAGTTCDFCHHVDLLDIPPAVEIIR